MKPILLIIALCAGGCVTDRPVVAKPTGSWLVRTNRTVETALAVPIFVADSLWASWQLSAFYVTAGGIQGPTLTATNRVVQSGAAK